MRVFLCWSGSRSKAVAEHLQAWLRRVIQAVDPWISEDIEKGIRWTPEVSTRLEESKIGIVCLTKDNLDSTWVHFEAGALSKTKDAHVCTFLLDVQFTDVKQPLGQFQHTTREKDDVRRLLSTINRAVERAGEKALAEDVLDDVFATYWQQLDTQLADVAASPGGERGVQRPDREILIEILEILRNQERRKAEQERSESEQEGAALLGLSRALRESHQLPSKLGDLLVRERLLELLGGKTPEKPEAAVEGTRSEST